MAGEQVVLLVGFGGCESVDDVPRFVESILGRRPPEHVVAEVESRYRIIGGGSPLPETTRQQATLLSAELAGRGAGVDVHVGMIHARPTVEEAAATIVANGASEVTVISLAPYRCEVSTDAYEEAAAEAFEGSGMALRFAGDWNLDPGYVAALAGTLAEALDGAPRETPVIFSAHSLPVRMIDQGDPYADQLAATAAAVAGKAGVETWRLAYQSVSAAAREPWLRPSVEEAMDDLAANGATAVMVNPIGFIADHVETLYDNDVEHRDHAAALGIAFYRCPCLNTHPGLIGTLADLAIAAMDGS